MEDGELVNIHFVKSLMIAKGVRLSPRGFPLSKCMKNYEEKNYQQQSELLASLIEKHGYVEDVKNS